MKLSSFSTPAGPLFDDADHAGGSLSSLSHFSLFIPLHYEPKYAYPLIVWLHGPGQLPQQLHQVMPLVSMRNYVAIAPQGRKRAGGGYCWRQTAADIAAAAEQVCQSIELARRRFHVAPQHVFLMGHGCGGTMALRLALQRPELFAGCISLSGPLPRGGAPLANVRRARHLPLLLAISQHGTQYPVERACEDLRLLHAAGFSVMLRQYPCGDELLPHMLRDANAWMMQLVTEPDAAYSATPDQSN